MGAEVESRDFSRQDRQRYRAKLHQCLDVFARMLSESKFDFERPLTGLEIEFNLVDERQDPAMRNAEVLAAIADAAFQTELGQFNIEINVRPRSLVARAAEELESELRALVSAELGKAFAPERILFVGALPKTRSAKIVRRAVRAKAVGADPGDLSSLENPETLAEIEAVVRG